MTGLAAGDGAAAGLDPWPADECRPTAVRRLPTLAAPGALQMAIDGGLLRDALFVTARRYVWSPPALSIGKFQRLSGEGSGRPLPCELVRRPSGGRAVLHGQGFEWSFAVVFPLGTLPGHRVDDAYRVVSAALAEAFSAAGVQLDGVRERPYRSAAFCFATCLRHDLLAAGHKVAAVAQTRRNGAVLVHGSVLSSARRSTSLRPRKRSSGRSGGTTAWPAQVRAWTRRPFGTRRWGTSRSAFRARPRAWAAGERIDSELMIVSLEGA